MLRLVTFFTVWIIAAAANGQFFQNVWGYRWEPQHDIPLTVTNTTLVSDTAGGAVFLASMRYSGEPETTLNHLAWLDLRGRPVYTNTFMLTNALPALIRATRSGFDFQIVRYPGFNSWFQVARTSSGVAVTNFTMGGGETVQGWPLQPADKTGQLRIQINTLGIDGGGSIPQFWIHKDRYLK